MNVRRVGPNQWEIFQTVPSGSGYSHAPTRDEVVLTLTDADAVSLLTDLDAIDHTDGSITALMQAHAAAKIAPALSEPPVEQSPVAVPLDVVAEHVATAERMPEPPSQV